MTEGQQDDVDRGQVSPALPPYWLTVLVLLVIAFAIFQGVMLLV